MAPYFERLSEFFALFRVTRSLRLESARRTFSLANPPPAQ